MRFYAFNFACILIEACKAVADLTAKMQQMAEPSEGQPIRGFGDTNRQPFESRLNFVNAKSQRGS